MKKNYIIIQDGLKSCGSACLLSIIRYYGGNVPMNILFELTNTTKEGTNFYDISKASIEVGLSAKAYKINSLDKLQETKKPFISQVITNNYKHFVVIYKIKNAVITIMDPAKGMVKLKMKDFDKLWTGYILLLEPYKKLPIYHENNYLNNIIIKVIKKNKIIILKLIILTIISVIFTSIYSYYLKIIIDNYLYQPTFNILTVTTIFMIILTIKLIAEYLRNNILTILNKKIDYSIIISTIRNIILLPYNYYKNKPTGEIIARINDLFYIKNVISKIITNIFLDIILSLFILYILFTINKNMTIILSIIIIIYFLTFIFYKRKEEYITNNLQESNAKVNSLLTESIISYETIKGLHLENTFINKINEKYQNVINNHRLLSLTIINENLIKDLTEGIVILYVTFFGITYVLNESLTLGSLITYTTLLAYFLTPIRNLFDFYKEFYYVRNSIKRVNNILNYKYESIDKESNLKINGNINFNNLTFSYDNQNIILNNITLDIKERSKVLLLGPSGSGKSTILKILYRYYNPKKNSVFIDNKDLLNYGLEEIRENITYVSQNEVLYTETIKNNIILDRKVTKESFEDVCNMTYVTNIVKGKDIAYDMPILENGCNLSGGERQRIVLARSLLKNTNIILIDEGLNQIDVNLERKILKNIFNYYTDKTIIIVSHRKDNMDLYDKVLKIKNKKIIEINKEEE